MIFGGSGIALNQGAGTLAADNTFTPGLGSPSNPYAHITNSTNLGMPMNYYHHINSAGYTLEPTAINPFDVNTISTQTNINPTNNCLTKLSYFIE